MKLYQKRGERGKMGLLRATVNGCVDTSAHYDFS